MHTPVMTSARWQRAKLLFEQALALPIDARAAWLADAADDETLCRTVLCMLEADQAAGPEPLPATALLEDRMDAWPPGRRIGPYLIEHPLGRGGMGEVYLARRDDGTVQQQVAIKRLRQDASHPDLRRRFLAERRILARLEHPHIARFLDAGADDDGRPYAVMEYVCGEPITTYVESHQLDIDATLALFIKVVDAVSHAHGQLIAHRDIKPGNVLVDAHGEPRLLDFGIAKPLSDLDDSEHNEHTAFELRCFSLRHAAPEQLRPGPVTTACDIYALGALLYELLAGQPPLQLEGLSYGEAERVVIEREPAAPSRVLLSALRHARARRVRGDLDRIVLHALEKSPQHRYSSAEAMAADLRRVLSLRPISLRAPHRWYRFSRFLRRNWLAVGLGSTTALVLLAGTILILVQARTIAERHQAAVNAQRSSEAIADLLLEAFDGADPTRSRGERVSAREVLDIAALRLRNRNDLDPRSAIELNSRLSEVLLMVAGHDSAQAAAERAVAFLDDNQSGELAVKAWVALARTGLARLDFEAAEAALASAELSFASNHFDSDAGRVEAEVAVGLMRVALLAARGQQIEAKDRASDLYEHARRELDDGHRLLYEAGATLAERLAATGQLDAATTHAEALLPRIDPAELDTIGRRLLSVLARALRTQERHVEGFDIQQRLLRGAEAMFGPSHPIYARNLTANADSAERIGRSDLADTYFRQAIALMEAQAAGESNTALALTLNNFASFLIRRDGPSDEAETASRRALASIDAALPEAHPNRGFMRLSLGHILLVNGRHSEAVQMLEEADQRFAALDAGPRTALPRAQVHVRLAAARLALGQIEAAHRNLAVAQARKTEILPPLTLDDESIELINTITGQLEASSGPKTRPPPPDPGES